MAHKYTKFQRIAIKWLTFFTIACLVNSVLVIKYRFWGLAGFYLAFLLPFGHLAIITSCLMAYGLYWNLSVRSMVEIPLCNSTMSLMNNSDTSPDARRVVCELYRRMTPARKFELISQAYEFGRSLAMAGIRLRHPEATDAQVHHMWARQHLGAELYEQAYGSKNNGQR